MPRLKVSFMFLIFSQCAACLGPQGNINKSYTGLLEPIRPGETGVSRHNRDPIMGAPQTPGYDRLS